MRKRRLRRNRNKRQIKLIIGSTLCLLMIMTAGYAAFSTNIALNTKGNVKDEKHIYVSSSGSDTEGLGTLDSPYKTINKAYTMALTNKPNTIYIMNNITQTETISMNSNKDITLTSCTKVGSSCTYTSANKITRDTQLTYRFFDLTSGELTLSNIIIDGNKENIQTAYTLIFAHDGGNLTVNEGTTLQNNYNTGNGGAITINSSSNVIINSGNITNNFSSKGGAIAIFDGTLTINSGNISNNTTTSDGGGIVVIGNTSVLNITSGTISNNTAEKGGAIAVLTGGTVTITNGTISNNTANMFGGGVLVWDSRGKISGTKFYLNGGTISNNIANEGGGIYNDDYVSMSGGTISDNTATSWYGGGIRNHNVFIQSGGVIKKNIAYEKDGGVSNENSYNRTGGYVCKNNSPTNSYDITDTTNPNCS